MGSLDKLSGKMTFSVLPPALTGCGNPFGDLLQHIENGAGGMRFGEIRDIALFRQCDRCERACR
jgi:hypothetical protein